MADWMNQLSGIYQGLSGTYGGAGDFGVVKTGDNTWTAVNQEAYNAIGDTAPKMTMADYNKMNKANTGWFGKSGYLDTGASVVDALSGLANAYTGLKQLGLSENEFAFNKALAETNLANQANLINEQRLNAGNVGLALAGSTMDDAAKQAVRDKITAGNVKGTI